MSGSVQIKCTSFTYFFFEILSFTYLMDTIHGEKFGEHGSIMTGKQINWSNTPLIKFVFFLFEHVQAKLLV